MAISKLEFFGDRDDPTPLPEVHARRPVLGTGKPPKELVSLSKTEVFYLHTTSNQKPSVRVREFKESKEKVWRVELPTSRTHGLHLPGRSAERQEPERLLKDIDRKASVAGYRPKWADGLFVPRRASMAERPALRRFDGRPAQPLYIFGDDDRWVFQDASWPWGLAGRIFNNRGQSGSAALIGDRIVMTAGHMVPWGDSPWWMRFVPAYYDGSSLHGAGVESYVSDARGYDVGGNVVGYDWAVLRLYDPLGTWLGYFGYNGYSSSWNHKPYWSIIGYPGMVANAQRPSFQGDITVNDTDSDPNGGLEIESRTADLTRGNSGGPMFAWWGNDPRLVGVVSGGEEDYQFPFSYIKENVMAGGSGFTSLAAWGRTNWPA